MKNKLLLFLAFISFIGYSQNPTRFVNGVQITGGQPTETSPTQVTTTTATGLQGKANPVDLPIDISPQPTNYTIPDSKLGSHLKGIDIRLGQIGNTTAGITNRIYFTGVPTTITAGTFYTSSATGKGAVAGVLQTVSNDDNVKNYFGQDVISVAQPSATTAPPGNYSGQLSVMVDNNSAQERFTVEIYKTNNSGTPIASGITGAPVGNLGVTVVAILDSGVTDLVASSVSNVSVSGNLASTLSLNVGEMLLYHVSAQKVGTSGNAFIFSLFYGSDYNSYYDVTVTPTTDGVVNKSTVVGVTTTDALNNISVNKEDVVNKSSSYTASSTTTYPNTKALVDGLATKIDENFIRYLLVGTNKAYKTIQQAIDAATNGDHILIDQGVYTNFLLPNTLKNITIEGIVGSKFSRDTQQWSEGVLVQGECSNNSSYSTIKNIGFSIPSGSAGNNIGTSTTLGHVKYIDCDFSGNSLSQPDHNILLNDGDYALFLRCNFYNSFHGLAIKVSYVNVEDCNFFDHGADLLIIRADNGMTGVHPYVHDINIVNCHLENKIEDRDGIYGVLLDSQNDGTVIDNVNIVNVSTKLLGFGFITAGSTLESISNINLTNCSADSCNDGLKLLGAKNVTISGWKSKNSVVNGIENFNVSGVQVTGANFENDNIPYNGNVSGFFRDNLFNSGINTSQPKSNFQVFDANGNGDRMSIYANGQSDGSGATLDFPMTLPDQTPNSIIARLRAKAFNGSSINSLEVYIGNWANSNNPGSIKSRWLSNGVFDHLGQIQLRGGSPTATSLLVSTNTDGLATWQEKASLGFATTDSPALTGVPTSPTATAGTNTTQIATTAFVLDNSMSLSGGQNFTGRKTFNSDNTISGGITVNNSKTTTTTFADNAGVYINNQGSAGIVLETHSGEGILGKSLGAGAAINVESFSNGYGLVLRNQGGTGDLLYAELGATRITSAGKLLSNNFETTGTMKMKEYTVATLPTPTGTAYATVSDALAPTYMAAVVGGGTVVTPVFYNGTTWVCH